jgi:hypothetical protein
MLLLKVIECWWLSLLFILHLVFVNGWSLFPLHSPGARSELFITLLLGHFSILFRLIQLVIMEKVLNAYEHIIYISYIWFAATLDWQPCECPYFGTSERTLVSLLLFSTLVIITLGNNSFNIRKQYYSKEPEDCYWSSMRQSWTGLLQLASGSYRPTLSHASQLSS